MLSIKKLEHVDDISFRELFGRIRVVFVQNKTCYVSVKHVFNNINIWILRVLLDMLVQVGQM
jgi:hypothetical protein